MMDKARQFHSHFFKGRLVIPSTNEFPQCGQQAEMCTLYLMCLLRQKLMGKQLDWNQLREFCFDETRLTYLRKLISNDVMRDVQGCM
jgi:hypothetical protein